MKISTTGLNLVKKFEGCYLTSYKCPAGVWTIGYGHTGKVDGKAICKGMKITKEKATALLKEDMEAFEKVVNNCTALTFKPNQNQFDALVSFAFNCGVGNLKTLVKDRTAGVVADKLLLYNKANGRVLNGLTNRRKAERELFLAKAEAKTEEPKVSDGKMPTIKKGSSGKAVKVWQIIVDAEPDGEFGPDTEKKTIAFQKAHGLVQDAIVGEKTWEKGLEIL